MHKQPLKDQKMNDSTLQHVKGILTKVVVMIMLRETRFGAYLEVQVYLIITLSIVQIIFYFWSFEISRNILRNQTRGPLVL